MILLTLVSAQNDHHWAVFLPRIGINENPAGQAPGGSFPSTSCFQVIHRYPVLSAPWTGMHQALHAGAWMAWSPSQGLSAPWVPSSVLAKLLPLALSALFPGLDSVTDNPWCSFPEFSLLRLLQPHPCLLPTGNSLGQWNLLWLHLHFDHSLEMCGVGLKPLLWSIISRMGRVCFPRSLSYMDPKFVYFSSSWNSQFRSSGLQFIYLLYAFLLLLLLPSLALHSCSDSCNGLLTTSGPCL